MTTGADFEADPARWGDSARASAAPMVTEPRDVARTAPVPGDADRGESAPVEAEPAAAILVFGERIDAARRYVELLAGPGMVRGLMGPREGARLWTRHVLNSAVLAEAIPAGARVVDIGSGAGLPGIPLALALPDCRVDLVESLERRADFLGEVVEELALSDRVRVIHGRAEDVVDWVHGADAVTARAVAPLGKLARWAAPLLRSGGLFVVLKGSSAGDEIERDRPACARAGVTELSVRLVGAHLVAEPTTLVMGRRSAAPAAGPGRGRARAAAARGRGAAGGDRRAQGDPGRKSGDEGRY